MDGRAGAVDDGRGLPSEWVPQLRRARGALTVESEVGLALRAHRRQLGLSQRAYALRRGLSRAMLARLEAGAGRLTLDTVSDALVGTGFGLFVGLASTDPDLPPEGAGKALGIDDATEPGDVSPRRLPPEAWAPTDLVARVRGGGRRFPAHRRVYAVKEPPMWWWMHEFFNGPTERPTWYSPVPRPDLRLPMGEHDDENDEHQEARCTEDPGRSSQHLDDDTGRGSPTTEADTERASPRLENDVA